MPYGIILLPDEQTRDAVVEYSRRICAVGRPFMTLGSSAPPHVTVLHVDGTRRQLETWWNSVSSSLENAVPVKLAGLIIESVPAGDFYVPLGGVVVSLGAVRRTNLEKVHGVAVDVARTVGLTPLGGFGENYRPHITLGVLEDYPETPIPFDRELAVASASCTPVLGELGPFGTFPHTIDRLADW